VRYVGVVHSSQASADTKRSVGEVQYSKDAPSSITQNRRSLNLSNTPDADAMNLDSLYFHGNEMYKNGTDMKIEQREASFEDMPLEDKLNRLRTTFPGAKDLDISTTLNKSDNNLWNAVKS